MFASVQSLISKGLNSFAKDHFDVVVLDEFHHAEAITYRAILDHVQPRELVGLTATPERADGVNVKSFFDDRIASELRLWDALDAEVVQDFLAGSNVVKTLNHIGYKDLEALARAAGDPDGRALALAGDDEAARAAVGIFVDRLGYDFVDAGPLATR